MAGEAGSLLALSKTSYQPLFKTASKSKGAQHRSRVKNNMWFNHKISDKAEEAEITSPADQALRWLHSWV